MNTMSSITLVTLCLQFVMVSSHEAANQNITDVLNSSLCNQPAFRFYRGSSLILDQLIPTDMKYSTCSGHQDKFDTVEICGSEGVAYQCALFVDNACGSGDIINDGAEKHQNLSNAKIELNNAYRILFSDPNDDWVTTSLAGQDDKKDIKSFLCSPNTTEDHASYMDKESYAISHGDRSLDKFDHEIFGDLNATDEAILDFETHTNEAVKTDSNSTMEETLDDIANFDAAGNRKSIYSGILVLSLVIGVLSAALNLL